MADQADFHHLESRAGLPEDLRWLVEKYPREDWLGHDNVHGMASMWLQRHDMFRELGSMLTTGIGDYRAWTRSSSPAGSRLASITSSEISTVITMSRTITTFQSSQTPRSA